MHGAIPIAPYSELAKSSMWLHRILPEYILTGFLNYGDTKYFDPGNKAVQQYVTNVSQGPGEALRYRRHSF